MTPQTTFNIPYCFYGGNLAAMRCKDKEVMLDGPAETGKTLAELYRLHACAIKYPGAQFSILRKIKADLYGTVLRTFHRDILTPYAPFVQVYGGKRPQQYDYPNGSCIWVGGLDDPGKTLSGERDIIYLAQAEQASLNDWEMLTRCVTGRGSVMPYTQLRGDCNPSHPTSYIIQRGKEGKLTRFTSTHKDNPTLWDRERGEWTEQGQRTRQVLSDMSGARRDRLYLGLWAAPEGAIYEVFDEARHKVARFEIPATWPRLVGIDPVGAYVAAVWVAFDPQNQTFVVYREYCEPFGVPLSQHARNILELSAGETIFWWVVGAPSERQPRADFTSYGIPAEAPAFPDVWSGIDRVNEMLTHNELFIMENCTGLLDEVGGYRRKMDRDGRATDVIEDKDTYHRLDALRYGVVGPDRPPVRGIAYMPKVIGY